MKDVSKKDHSTFELNVFDKGCIFDKTYYSDKLPEEDHDIGLTEFDIWDETEVSMSYHDKSP